MAASAKILADSISPDGVRLTSFEVVLARPALAELNTHRMLSKNSASSRAIPFEKMIARVLEDPYIPEWTQNQKGMQGPLLDPDSHESKAATRHWLELRDRAIETVTLMGDMGIHKQDVNRALEPWMWHTVIITATELDNFWHLRDHTAAYLPMQRAAKAMRKALAASTPRALNYGEWHMPLVSRGDNVDFGRFGLLTDDPEEVEKFWCKVSVGRCARVSYLTHDGKRDPQADIDLHDSLLKNGHLSPFEHVARPLDQAHGRDNKVTFIGNFRGWVQYRKTIPGEDDILGSVYAET